MMGSDNSIGGETRGVPAPRFTERIGADVDEIIERVGDAFQKLSGTTLLVTGANGFLCSYFVDTVAALNDKVLKQRCHVVALDNYKVGLPSRLAHLGGRDDITFLRHDIAQPLDIERADWVIHGASIASPVFYRQYPLETISANVNGMWHLLEMSRSKPVQSILYLSTSEIYGDPDPAFIPTPEEYRGQVSCTGPRACYDESKRLAETLCMSYFRQYGTPVKVMRPFNVYGPGQRLDDGRIIPDLIGAAVRREPITIYSDGRATRAFCYVSDAVSAMWHVLLSDADGEIFNVGNDQEEITVRGVAERLREVAGPPLLDIQYRTSADEHFVTDNPQRRCPDLTRLRQRFPWEPQVDLTRGLERTLSANLELARAAAS
ncbi:MAG TPA: NAD-dependent epimerase/dehydratase family protein [Pyrinomonadaceae bacterium]|nr:NAD-dependent epimerase/dehydratase family protein [Pyrinomonadaceae bacterium]